MTHLTAKLVVGLLLAAVPVASAPTAQAVIVDRVVAIIGEKPIFLTDLQKRAHPFRLRVYEGTQDPKTLATQDAEVMREVLDRMIEEGLEEQVADKSHVSIGDLDVERALQAKADSAHITKETLLAEAKHQGLTESEYRDELRRQVLEGKLLQLRVVGRVRVTEDEVRAAYAHYVSDAGPTADARLLVKQLPPGASPEQLHAIDGFAQNLFARATSGEDFCDLVTTFSDDSSTRGTCGSHGETAVSTLLPEIQEAAKNLKQGEVGAPVHVGSEAIVIVQMNTAAHLPTYDEVKPAMQERAYADSLERQRKQWLLELRKNTRVDDRLERVPSSP